MRKLFKLAKALLCCTVITLGITGCGSASPASSDAANGTLKIATTTTQLHDFMQQLSAGQDVKLTGLLKPGASAHSFDPSPADLKALAEADILVVNGAGLDDFINTAIKASGFSGKIVTAAAGVDLQRAAEITAAARAAGDPGHGSAAAAQEQNVPAAANSQHYPGAATAVDPHLWTSPRFARAMLQPLTAALSAADPVNSQAYTANAEKYDAKLAALDEWLSTAFAQADPQHKKFVSTHNALLYFLHDYDITYVGSVIPSFEDNAEPSAAELQALIANIKRERVPAIFVESSNSPRLNSTVAAEAGIPVITEPLYADSLAPSGAASTYIGATIANAHTMLTAWGYELGEAPSALQ